MWVWFVAGCCTLEQPAFLCGNMKNIFSFLRLVRYPNLFFVVLTQYFFQYLIVVPILSHAGMSATLIDINFALLVLSTVLLAAAGYIINDYFDVKMDAINKPRKLFISKSIKRRPAILAHQIFTSVAIVIGIYVAWVTGNVKLAFINPIVATLLWYYSTSYKRQPFIGNFIVAFLTALVIPLLVFYEQPLFHPQNNEELMAAYGIFIRTFFYFIFAFLVSLIREIIKDMEDIEGDETYGCRTLPIVFGIPKTKLLVYFLCVVVIGLVALVQSPFMRVHDYARVIYLFQTVQFPVFLIMWLLLRADTQKDFNRISTLVKVVMLMGIFTMAYFYFSLA